MPKQAMTLCGAFGTRLGFLTAATHKPRLPVGERPFLDVLLCEFGRHGFEDIVLLDSFGSDQVRAYATDHPLARRSASACGWWSSPSRTVPEGRSPAGFTARRTSTN
ncbi:hypothetical protein ACQVP2_31175 [Methylobacterium aquaticum]|uniref:hypothetical protein n=1 Tax=Methylobacterium aquaticum TaxID=270351 RepID=UPI003D186B18